MLAGPYALIEGSLGDMDERIIKCILLCIEYYFFLITFKENYPR